MPACMLAMIGGWAMMLMMMEVMMMMMTDDDDDEGGAGGGSEIRQENERMSGRIFLLPAIDPYDRRRLSYQMYGRCVAQFQEIFFLGS